MIPESCKQTRACANTLSILERFDVTINREILSPPLMSSVGQRRYLAQHKPTWETERNKRVEVLRLGIPNTGKLKELTGDLVSCIYDFNYASKQLSFKLENDLEILRARSTDLPHLLAQGIVDLAITGSDYCFESGADLVQVHDLALITGAICLLTKDGALPGSQSGSLPILSTQYPKHASYFLENKGLEGEVRVVSGAGELYPRIGLSDASVDCVVTGRTARHNGLKIAAKIRDVTTGVYRRKEGDHAEKVQAIEDVADRLMSACRQMQEGVMARSPF